MKQKRKIVLSSVVAFIFGFAISLFLNVPLVPDSLKADIGKLGRYKKEVVSKRTQIIVEQLNNDEAFKNQTLSTLTIAAAQAGSFRVNATLSQEACRPIPQLEKTAVRMKDIEALSHNAAQHAYTALAMVEAALQGEKVEVEKPLNNALLSFLYLNKKASVAQQYVEDIDTFLKGKDVEAYEDLAFSRDQWANYGAMDAFYHADAQSMEYWSKLNALLPASKTISYQEALPAEIQIALAASQIVNDNVIQNITNSIEEGNTPTGLMVSNSCSEVMAILSQEYTSPDFANKVSESFAGYLESSGRFPVVIEKMEIPRAQLCQMGEIIDNLPEGVISAIGSISAAELQAIAGAGVGSIPGGTGTPPPPVLRSVDATTLAPLGASIASIEGVEQLPNLAPILRAAAIAAAQEEAIKAISQVGSLPITEQIPVFLKAMDGIVGPTILAVLVQVPATIDVMRQAQISLESQVSNVSTAIMNVATGGELWMSF